MKANCTEEIAQSRPHKANCPNQITKKNNCTHQNCRQQIAQRKYMKKIPKSKLQELSLKILVPCYYKQGSIWALSKKILKKFI